MSKKQQSHKQTKAYGKRQLWDDGERKRGKQVHRTVKDRLFRFLFGQDREALLTLYNALNGTDYHDASQLKIVTIESAIYIVMKNDLAFVLAGTLNMYEHQSTWNPNLPVRFLIYLAQEYQTLLEKAEESLYGTKKIVLPTPKCVIFYNGTKEMPEEKILKLSDAFDDRNQQGDVELTVRMLNINYGHNHELMENCRILREYSEFVQISRDYMINGEEVRKALSEAIDYCIGHGILSEFLKRNRMEVLGMFLEEFDAEKYERTIRREGREEGEIKGRREEREQSLQNVIELLEEMGHTREIVRLKLVEKYSLPETEAEQKLLLYWK